MHIASKHWQQCTNVSVNIYEDVEKQVAWTSLNFIQVVKEILVSSLVSSPSIVCIRGVKHVSYKKGQQVSKAPSEGLKFDIVGIHNFKQSV